MAGAPRAAQASARWSTQMHFFLFREATGCGRVGVRDMRVLLAADMLQGAPRHLAVIVMLLSNMRGGPDVRGLVLSCNVWIHAWTNCMCKGRWVLAMRTADVGCAADGACAGPAVLMQPRMMLV